MNLRSSDTTQHQDQGYFREILGLEEQFTLEDVNNQYRHLTAQYQPEAVEHLSAESKKLAEEEIKEIKTAYEYFRKKLEYN